jgi:hypothetical protein
MRDIRVKNLHCIEDTGIIPLNGITLLVGANSTGKSTLLRVFPLLKQSLNYNKRGPILWYGDSVDFGSFQEAHRRGGEELSISFTQRLDLYNMYRQPSNHSLCKLDYVIDARANEDYLKYFSLSFDDTKIEMTFTSGFRLKDLKINDWEVPQIANHILIPSYFHFVPQARFINSVKAPKGNGRRFNIKESDVIAKLYDNSGLQEFFTEERLISFCETIRFESANTVHEKIKAQETKKNPFGDFLDINSAAFKRLYAILVLYNL